jgi:hypothetical protein
MFFPVRERRDMGLFGKSTFLEKELEAWSLETWSWLMRAHGGMARLQRTPLVLPDKDFFPPTDTEGAERGRYVFDMVCRWMGIHDSACALESYDRPPANAHLGGLAMVKGPSAPSGTFRTVNGQPVVSYALDLLEQPRVLIATLAHELSHYLIARAWTKGASPGGADAHELATELCVAYCGFAVFGANAAFEFGQFQGAGTQGWSSQRRGYFSERSWAFALAVFLALKGEATPSGVLKPSVAGLTDKAARYLTRNPGLLEPLRAIS